MYVKSYVPVDKRETLMRLSLPIALCLACCSMPAGAQAQLEEGIKEWADATSGVTTAIWAGQRVPFPVPEARPAAAYRLESVYRPLAVQAPEGLPVAQTEQVLSALEYAHDVLEAAGWTGDDQDAGAGGTAGRDLYLVHGLEERAAAGLDAVEPFDYLDRGRAFAMLDAAVEPDRLLTCTVSAYVQARLLGLDPAEGISVRRAVGAYAGWLVTGKLGCDDSPERAVEQPWRTLMGEQSSEDGALWLALLGAARDGNRGRVVWQAAQLARQRTWEGEHLRGSPDLWEALDAILKAEGSSFNDAVEDVAVARFDARHVLPGRPPVWHEMRYEELPARTRPAHPALQTLGSAYAIVHTPGRKAGEQLRVWMRGETRVQWSLVAVRLDAEGRERGRISAPPRRETKSFVVVDLDEQTERVLLVVTNLSHRLPDADAPDNNTRSAYLIVDK